MDEHSDADQTGDTARCPLDSRTCPCEDIDLEVEKAHRVVLDSALADNRSVHAVAALHGAAGDEQRFASGRQMPERGCLYPHCCIATCAYLGKTRVEAGPATLASCQSLHVDRLQYQMTAGGPDYRIGCEGCGSVAELEMVKIPWALEDPAQIDRRCLEQPLG